MKNILIILTIAGTLFPIAETRTFQNVLGKDRVDEIMKEVITKAEARQADKFLVSDESINRLKTSGLPNSTVKQLETLKGKEVQGKGQFLEELQLALGKQDVKRFKAVILLNTQGALVVTEEFFEPVEAMILKTEVVEPRRASKSLRMGFGRFLDHYVEFLDTTSTNKTNRVTLGKENLEQFIESRRATCNISPCDIPPCCDLCLSCKSIP
jgi:hypothetical protein